MNRGANHYQPRGDQTPKVAEELVRAQLGLPLSVAARELRISLKTLMKYETMYDIRFERMPKHNRRPDKEVFDAACATMTVIQLAGHFGVAKSTINTWRRQLSAKPLPGGYGQLDEPDKLDCAKSVERLSKPMGEAFGGTGWHNMAGIEMARANHGI